MWLAFFKSQGTWSKRLLFVFSILIFTIQLMYYNQGVITVSTSAKQMDVLNE